MSSSPDCAPTVAAPAGGSNDLGLTQSIEQPACDGTGIVVLYNAVAPGRYADEIRDALTRHPGARYLRTDHSCPSLRQRIPDGSAIYAVYRPAGSTVADVCAAVRREGDDAYGKWLDTTTDPAVIISC